MGKVRTERRELEVSRTEQISNVGENSETLHYHLSAQWEWERWTEFGENIDTILFRVQSLHCWSQRENGQQWNNSTPKNICYEKIKSLLKNKNAVSYICSLPLLSQQRDLIIIITKMPRVLIPQGFLGFPRIPSFCSFFLFFTGKNFTAKAGQLQKLFGAISYLGSHLEDLQRWNLGQVLLPANQVWTF